MAGLGRVRIHPMAALAWFLFLGALVAASWLAPDETMIREVLEGLGPLAPTAFVLAEIVQVVVIPIPGQPIEITGGYLFGLAAGTLLASLGAVAGSIIAFALGRRYGRPWVERRVAPDVRARFGHWIARGDRAEWAIFWLMLIPAFPRDPLCYLAGLTPVSARRFALIAAIGRLVGLVPWVALGANGVALGLKLQIGLAAGAGTLWLAHIAWTRWARAGRRAP